MSKEKVPEPHELVEVEQVFAHLARAGCGRGFLARRYATTPQSMSRYRLGQRPVPLWLALDLYGLFCATLPRSARAYRPRFEDLFVPVARVTPLPRDAVRDTKQRRTDDGPEKAEQPRRS